MLQFLAVYMFIATAHGQVPRSIANQEQELNTYLPPDETFDIDMDCDTWDDCELARYLLN